VDEPLAQFLREMESEDTTIMLFSDHGPHVGGIKTTFRDYPTEKVNPFVFIDNFQAQTDEQQANVEYNQQKLLTHMHTYNFFKYWATGVEHGPSFVSKLGSDKDTCDFIG
jgi:arylsulfatase A-like enzyme